MKNKEIIPQWKEGVWVANVDLDQRNLIKQDATTVNYVHSDVK